MLLEYVWVFLFASKNVFCGEKKPDCKDYVMRARRYFLYLSNAH